MSTKRLKTMGIHSQACQAKQLAYEARLAVARAAGFAAYCESQGMENPFTDERVDAWFEGYTQACKLNGGRI